jgi:hypothetical protein
MSLQDEYKTVLEEIKEYEDTYKMSSAEFVEAWRNGDIPDTFEGNVFISLIKTKEQIEAENYVSELANIFEELEPDNEWLDIIDEPYG